MGGPQFFVVGGNRLKKRNMTCRLLSALLAMLLCMSCVCSPIAFAAGEDGESQQTVGFTDENTTIAESNADEAAKTDEENPQEPHGDGVSADVPQEEQPAESVREEGGNPGKSEVEANFGEVSQAFVDAVSAIDRDAVLRTANAWGLAHRDWMQNQDDPDLTAALDEATAASDEAAAPLYAAEDLFYAISEDEQENEAVQAAFLSLMSLFAAMHEKMDNPTDPNAGGDDEPPTEPEDDEIAAILYGDLPDAPTGNYLGSYGLPVAVGKTKIGVSEWTEQLLSDTVYRLDAGALDSDNISITIPAQQGESYAIVPVLVQVEYPANGSTSTVILPDGVTLLSQDGSGRDASAEEAVRILNQTYRESSAAVSGFFVRASEDFSVQFNYSAPDGTTLEKNLAVHIDKDSTRDIALYGLPTGSSTYAERPTPAVTTGKVTHVEKVNGTWLVWFNGEPAYCCDHGKWAAPGNCPTYTYSHTSIVAGSQYTPGDHYKNQMEIWGGLGQLSLGLLRSGNGSALFSAEEASACYDDVQKWIMENYPDSVAAKTYRNAVDQMAGGAIPYATASDYYCYVYAPPAGLDWQRISVIGPEIPSEYYARWEAPPQTASGEFDFSFSVQADKQQLVTQEKVDSAVIEIEPIITSGTISGGNWSLSPAGRQIITTSGHTMDDAYHTSGGAGTASWSLHYTVEKTSITALSGNAGPCRSQAEADAMAESAKAGAIDQLKEEAQRMVDAAISSAKEELASLRFSYIETGVPHGFDVVTGPFGSEQTITVPANTEQSYVMRNDEWSLQVRIDKRDSETGERIRGNAAFAVFEWDTVLQRCIPFGNYNQYKVERQADGTYAVINHSGYATADPACSTMFYTQRNEGKFIIVETQAPSGYFGDWTDVSHPGAADSVKGKRAYFVEITKENDGSVLWLDNADYNASIGMADNGGVLLDTGSGIVSVTISDTPLNADKTYITDKSGIAANEDGRTVLPVEDRFLNDRVLGEIILSKVDLDAMRYLAAGSNGNTTLEGAVYDLYAAEDIRHPDGVSGIVDYGRILDASGAPIWHTVVLTNDGRDNNYLPVLQKDHLVASAAIKDGRLAFANLYLGKYYLVERAAGLALPLDANGQIVLEPSYPLLNRQLQPTGSTRPLARNGAGEYTDYVYRNRFSAVAEGRALNGSKTYDGYYISFASGYLCDEVNHYVTLSYGNESGLVVREEVQSADEVLKSGFSINKLVSTTGQPGPAIKLDGAGFTVYRISDLSRADKFIQNPDGSYQVQSILDAYRADSYDQDHAKYDFSGETQAIATMYEGSQAAVDSYNRSLTASADNAGGSGAGWQPTGKPGEYQLSEVFTNSEGILRVDGLAYGQYLVVETTVPRDLFQAAPFLVTVDASSPQSVFCTPQGSTTAPSGSYMTYNILDEELEGYLQLIKIDAETGKAVKLAKTAFSLFCIHEDGTMQLVEMNDPASGNATVKTSVFYTDENGLLKTAEKLPLGRYRVVEVQGPEGFYNDESYHVDFELTSERIYEVIGSSADGMDDYILTEKYVNRETLGQLTIRKLGEVLTGWKDGQFEYKTDALAGAVYEIRAHGDVFTGDHQTDANGNRTLWYADGDLVATVTTGGAGQIDQVDFAPTRTSAAYNFLAVSHNGIKGEVTITLPLGSYEVIEVKAPYGYTLADTAYTVTFGWNNQTNDLVLAETIVSHADGKDKETAYRIVNIKDADDKQLTEQKLVFKNDRVLPVIEKGRVGVGLYKLDRNSAGFTDDFSYKDGLKTDTSLFEGGSNKAKIPAGAVPVAGATYELYTADAIYSADGKLLAEADTLLGTATTDENGLAAFNVDVPIRGEQYGTSDAHNAATNSGRYYLREVSAPEGYLIEQSVIPIEFTYEGQQIAWQVVDCLHTDKATEVEIDKRGFAGTDLSDSFALPGATLTVTDWRGKVVDEWTSGDAAHIIRGLALDHDFAGNSDLGHIYTLTETRPADGYTTARSIRFKLVQAQDDSGNYLQQTEVWVLKETPSGEVISGSIVSPVTFADDVPQTGFFAGVKDAVLTFVDRLTGAADENPAGSETVQQAIVIADWQIAGGTLTVSFTKNATPAAIEKCLRESDFAGYSFERVYLENGESPRFFADQQVAEKPEDAEVTYTGEWGKAETVTMLDAPTVIRVCKADITTQEEVVDASLQITDKNGKLVEQWISDSEPHMIEGKLIAGETYTLTETLAPTAQGYVPAASIEFTVQDDGKVQTVFMQDDFTKLQISKTDIATGEELPGASLQIVDQDDKVIEEWASTDTPHYIERIPVGKYTLVETSAPDGYIVSESVAFEVLPTGEIQAVEMKDDFTKVQISKTDIATGEELPGATLQITDENGKIVEEWTSTTEPHLIERLPIGKYTLIETSAPEGYIVSESVVFEVLPTGGVQTVEMKDDFTKVQISKTDIATGEELPGAKLRVEDENGKIVEEWTSVTEPHLIERLPIGKYTLVETSAPAGYLVAESIAFEATATGEIQKVVMKDERIPAPPETPVPPQPVPPVPKTGDLPWLPAVLGGSAILALLGYAAWQIRDKRREDN